MASTYEDIFSKEYLKQPPVKRAAYSDRMALIMAWMSHLAYIKFENPGATPHANDAYLASVVERITADSSPNNVRDVVKGILENPPSPSGQHTWDDLEAELKKVGFELVKTYSLNNHQAFLAKRVSTTGATSQEPKEVVLSFRGTESTNKNDWKKNLKATTDTIDGNVTVHSGYWQSFAGIGNLIMRDLNPLLEEGYTLYITGHSMGGALAMIATHEIGHDSAGACYTFGGPRVAGYGFADKIKTPIYRVVNANDLVPRMPPFIFPQLLHVALTLSPIPWKAPLQRLLTKFTGYVHHGDLRYLRRANRNGQGQFENVQLLQNPNMVHRLWWYIKGFLKNRKSPINDHAILLYAEKLKQRALERR